MPIGSDPAFDPSVATAYLICTAPRSGSTLLCGLLASTGIAGDPQSYFHHTSLAQWLADLALNEELSGDDRATLGAIVTAIRDRLPTAGAPVGVRVQGHSAPFFFAQLARFMPELGSDLARLTAAFGQTRFVHLHRKDKVAQAVSYVLAEQSGLWHRAADGTELERSSPPKVPVYDGAAIAAEVARLWAYDKYWNDWFDREGITPLRLDYDALSQDPGAAVSDVLVHLGIADDTPARVTPTVARLADARNAQWIARFRSDTGDAP